MSSKGKLNVSRAEAMQQIESATFDKLDLNCGVTKPIRRKEWGKRIFGDLRRGSHSKDSNLTPAEATHSIGKGISLRQKMAGDHQLDAAIYDRRGEVVSWTFKDATDQSRERVCSTPDNRPFLCTAEAARLVPLPAVRRRNNQ